MNIYSIWSDTYYIEDIVGDSLEYRIVLENDSSLCDVQLLRLLDVNYKIAVIQLIRDLFGYSLAEAKDLVDNAPSIIATDITWDEAQHAIQELSYLSAQARVIGDSKVIYSGKAYKFPNSDTVKININKICQNYLNSNIHNIMQSLADTGMLPTDEDGNVLNDIEDSVHTFSLYKVGENIPAATWTFINDWSYQRKQFSDIGTLPTFNAIINAHYAEGMICFDTSYAVEKKKLWISTGNDGTYWIPSCGDYAIYFQNLWGGWNSFLIEGDVTITDNINSYLYNRAFNNNTVEFEEGRYIAEIKSKYNLNTGLLDDEEAETLVKHLLSSNATYLHDLKKNTVIPIVITNKDLIYKTYRNQNGTPFNYVIEVQASQTKIRN